MKVRVAVLSIASVVVFGGALGGAGATPTGPSLEARNATALAAAKKSRGAVLADQILSRKKRRFARAVKATRQVLALSGVATLRDGQEIVAPVAPRSTWRVSARETVLMAKGARTGMLTLGTIGRYFAKVGVNVGYMPIESLLPRMGMAWIGGAAARPAHPLSAPALFMLRMQEHRASRISPLGRWLKPHKVWLSPLEAIVLLANLERTLRPADPEPAEQKPPAYDDSGYEDDYEPAYDDELFRASAAGAGPTARTSAGPCASVQEALNAQKLGDVGSAAAQLAISEISGNALGNYADSLRDGAGRQLGIFLTGLDMADRVLRSAAFAQNVAVDVWADDGGKIVDEVHKPFRSPDKVSFVAVVGLDKEGRKELEEQLAWSKDHAFQESMADCAKLHGITIPRRPYADLADEMTKWYGFWKLNAARDDLKPRPPLSGKLKRIDPAQTASTLRALVQTERRVDHVDRRSLLVKRTGIAEIEVRAEKPPDPVSIAKFAYAIGSSATAPPTAVLKLEEFLGPAADMVESVFRLASRPRGSAALEVNWHRKNPCLFRPAGRAHVSC